MADIAQLTLEESSVNCPGDSRTETEHIRLDNTVTSQRDWSKNCFKAIYSRRLIEFYLYEVPLLLNCCNKHPKSKLTNRTEEYQKRNANKAIFEVKRLIYGNFKEYDKFISLTFADTDKFNINSLGECEKYKIGFLNKLKQIKNNLKYIVVPEFQKRGAVHYHILCDLDYLPKKELEKNWVYGFSDIRAIDNLDKQALYIAKYIQKNRKDKRFKGKRTYIKSKNLRNPQIFYGNEAFALFTKIKQLNVKPIRKGSFETTRNGLARFAEYISPNKELL